MIEYSIFTIAVKGSLSVYKNKFTFLFHAILEQDCAGNILAKYVVHVIVFDVLASVILQSTNLFISRVANLMKDRIAHLQLRWISASKSLVHLYAPRYANCCVISPCYLGVSCSTEIFESHGLAKSFVKSRVFITFTHSWQLTLDVTLAFI